MKNLPRVALLAALAIAGCQQTPSRLDKITSKTPAPGATSPGQKPAEAPAGLKIDRSGSVEQQLARLQDAYDRNAEAIDFLNKVYAQQKAQQAAQEREEPAEDATFAVDVAPDVKLGQVEGPAGALVTIVEAWDFAWPYCQRVSSTLEDLVKDYNGKVRVVFKNMVVHPQVVTDAHHAGCAAAKQGKFVEFKHAFWDKAFGPYAASGGKDTASLGADSILKIAQGAGLDTAKLKADMDSAECKAQVEADMAELAKWHVNSTPTFFINGKEIAGALSKEAFKQVIDEKLKIAEASGVPAASYYDKEVMEKGEKQFRSKVDPKPH